MPIWPWIDYLQFARTMTPTKVRNAWKVYDTYRRSLRRGTSRIQGMPISISIEPTTACNLRCPECPSGLRSFTRPTGKIDRELYDNILKQHRETLCYLLLYFQGEPFLHPEFINLVKRATAQGIYTATSTNAHFIDRDRAQAIIDSGLHRLIISIDGTEQATYQAYRREGQLEKVIKAAEHLVRARKKARSKTPHLIFQFLVVRQNEHQIPDIYRLAKQIGIDEVKLKTAQIYDYENGSPLIPQQNKYSRYRQLSGGKWEIKNKLDNRCWKMWHSCVITWDGQVVPCCFDKDATYAMGNVQQESFRAIWNNTSYQRFREKILEGRSSIDICRNCTEGMEIWA